MKNNIDRFNHCISDRLLRRRLLKICGQNYSMVEVAHSAYVANEFRQRYALQLADEPSLNSLKLFGGVGFKAKIKRLG